MLFLRAGFNLPGATCISCLPGCVYVQNTRTIAPAWLRAQLCPVLGRLEPQQGRSFPIQPVGTNSDYTVCKGKFYVNIWERVPVFSNPFYGMESWRMLFHWISRGSDRSRASKALGVCFQE